MSFEIFSSGFEKLKRSPLFKRLSPVEKIKLKEVREEAESLAEENEKTEEEKLLNEIGQVRVSEKANEEKKDFKKV